MYGKLSRHLALLMRSSAKLLGDSAGAFALPGTSRGKGKMTNTADDLSIPNKLVRPASGTPEAVKVAPDSRSALALAPTPAFFRAGNQPSTGSLLPAQGSSQAVTSADVTVEARKLIIGEGTALSGEINACDQIVVEGTVRANLQKCQRMTIAQSGLFDGNAAIDDAEIYGRFEGDLVVHHRLIIRSTGRVSGTITYGEIEIEAGGRIAGTIQAR